MSEESDRAARKEVNDFYEAIGVYSAPETASETIDLFIERNHVVHLPEPGELIVTESEMPSLSYRLAPYTQQMINGEYFSSNSDPFFWQERIEKARGEITDAEDELKNQVLLQAKRRAVLAYLTEKQAKETQYAAERQARRDALANEYLPGTNWAGLLKWVRDLIDRLIDAEDRADAVKP